MKVILSGAMGRMGQAVIARLRETGHDVAAMVDPKIDSEKGFTSIKACDVSADVIIDFSSPKALCDLLAFAVEKQIPLVLATTGYSEADLQQIDEASRRVAIFRSANMSLGINVLKDLIQKAAKILGDDFDVEIIETHHNQKMDAPSGTALLLYDALKDAYRETREIKPGRYGAEAKRGKNEIGIHAVRGGTVPGIHEVGFFGQNEVITLTHSAQNRDVFAVGAVRAAEYMVKTEARETPRLYTMADVVG